MRRSASEIIRNLERRIARLEKQAIQKTKITDIVVFDEEEVVEFVSGRKTMKKVKMNPNFLRTDLYTDVLTDGYDMPFNPRSLKNLVDDYTRNLLLEQFDFSEANIALKDGVGF